jgi:hypothetical protein
MKLLRRLSRFSLVSILVCGAAVALSEGTAAAASAPTIVKAVMVAASGSQQADKIVLTYSKAVTFSKEKTGPFPFSVEGYVVTSVAAAKQTKIVIHLAERSTSDLTVTPFVTYTVPGTDQVQSTKGVPAPDQTFIQTTAAAPASAVYVATTGNDTNPGTEASPKATIQAAIATAAAETPIPDVYVSAGTYSGPSALSLQSGVNVDGGYTPGTWTRSLTAVTTIEGAPTAVIAEDVTGVTLQLLSLSGMSNSLIDSSLYGLREVDSNVSLEWVSVSAATGNAGASGSGGQNGTDGGNGASGANGGTGGTGTFDGGAGGAPVSGDTNGSSGQSGSGRPDPGSGGAGTSSAGTLCGPPGVNAPDNATAGGSGSNGFNGPAGSTGTPGPSWNAGSGLNGASGTSGSGGGGGGSGSGAVSSGNPFCTEPINETGGGGGGGGAGGGGGVSGTAGMGGGGSFGNYLFGSVVSVDANCTVSAGNGGAGGAGGNGGIGGSLGTGGAGQAGQGGTAGAGAPGADGGQGGSGGSGSGGSGGPSIGVLEADSSSATIASGATITFGTGGTGGSGGSNSELGQAPSGVPGAAEEVATF